MVTEEIDRRFGEVVFSPGLLIRLFKALDVKQRYSGWGLKKKRKLAEIRLSSNEVEYGTAELYRV